MVRRMGQVLRLPVLAPAIFQPPAAASASSADGQLVPGLGLVFPACPSCAHRAFPQQQGPDWQCRHCGVAIRDGDAVWTFRLAFMATIFGTGRCAGASEGFATVLGPAAGALFGCPASQWVEDTDTALRVLSRLCYGSASHALQEDLAERLCAMMDMCAGISGQYVELDLRQASVIGRNNKYHSQYTVSRIQTMADPGPGIAHLWKFVVYDALTTVLDDSQEYEDQYVANAQQLLSLLEPDVCLLQIAEELSPACCIVEFADGDNDGGDPTTHGSGEAYVVEGEAILSEWSGIYGELEESAQQDLGSISADDLETGAMDDSEIDQLLNDSSQLFVFDSPMGMSGPGGSYNPHDDDDDDGPLSAHLFEESLQDDYRHSLFLDSQQQPMLDASFPESQLYLLDSHPVLSSQDCESSPLFDGAGIQTPMRRRTSFGASLCSLGTISIAASCQTRLDTPTLSLSARAADDTSQPWHQLHRDGSFSEDRGLLVLAEDTPIAQGPGRSKRKLDFLVPETPTYGGAPRRGRIGTPSLSRHASAGHIMVIPETPAAIAGQPASASVLLPSHPTAASQKKHSQDHRRYQPLTMSRTADTPEDPWPRPQEPNSRARRPVKANSETRMMQMAPLDLRPGSSFNDETGDQPT
ncbi:hypothetical protein GGF46_001798 [Coemansia sp. RSA 552]|nr:hypothetical protein GGF46_001798 [Coemansia sp. RSA 552]